jgi:hypothetical protein
MQCRYAVLRPWPARTGRGERSEQRRAASGGAARPTRSTTTSTGSTQSALLARSQQGITPAAKSPLNASRTNSQSPPCGRLPEGPRTSPPVCIRLPALFSARSRTRGGQIGCGGLPAISAFQRHSSQHLSIHCRSPSSGPLLLLQNVPFGCVQRTGCSACGLGHPHQVLVGSPHVHSSRLVPVGFASFLIKCLHFRHWH